MGQSPRVVSSFPSSTESGLASPAHKLGTSREASAAARIHAANCRHRSVGANLILFLIPPASFREIVVAPSHAFKRIADNLEFKIQEAAGPSPLSNRQSKMVSPLPMSYHGKRQRQIGGALVRFQLQVPIAGVILGNGRKRCAVHGGSH